LLLNEDRLLDSLGSYGLVPDVEVKYFYDTSIKQYFYSVEPVGDEKIVLRDVFDGYFGL